MTPESCRPGSGQLRIMLSGGQSTATSVRATSPLKLLVPRSRGPSVWACISSLGGGLVQGDQIALSISLGEGARAYLGTQASTKVYRNPMGRPCTQSLRVQLDRGAFLAVLPDPVQSFGGSHYRQQQEFRLHPDSGLVLVDWLSAGRAARGERWAFARYQSRNELWVGGTRALVDSLVLDPADGPLAGRYRMGRFNCLALVVVAGGLLREASTGLLEEFARSPVSPGAGLVASASPIQPGALLRFAGESVQAVTEQIHQRLVFVADWLGDLPWRRKY